MGKKKQLNKVKTGTTTTREGGAGGGWQSITNGSTLLIIAAGKFIFILTISINQGMYSNQFYNYYYFLKFQSSDLFTGMCDTCGCHDD